MWIDLCPLLELLRDEPRFVTLRQVVEARASQIRAAMETRCNSPIESPSRPPSRPAKGPFV